MAQYSIAGVTRLDGAIAQATMRLYEAVTGELRATTQSDPATGEYEFLSSGMQTGDPYWGETRMLLEFENSFSSSGLEAWSGTAVGAVTFSTAFKHSGSFSAGFPGTSNAYVNYGTDPTGRLDFDGASFTIEAWVYLTSYPASGTYRTIVQNLTDSPQGGWRLLVNSSGYLHVSHYPVTGTAGFGLSSIPVPLNTWVHVACAYDKEAARYGLFIGGVGTYANAVINIKPTAGAAKTLVGITTDYQSWRWAGYIDDIRITNGICRYKSNFTPAATYEKGPLVDSVMASGETFFVLADYGEGIRPLAHGPIDPSEVDFVKWTPAAQQGLEFWVDAQDSGTLTISDTNVISTWADKSGSGRNLAQTTFANRPKLIQDTYNGHPVVSFDGVDDYLSVADWWGSNSAQAVTMFVVGNATFEKGKDGSGDGWSFVYAPTYFAFVFDDGSSGAAGYSAGNGGSPQPCVKAARIIPGSGGTAWENSVQTAAPVIPKLYWRDSTIGWRFGQDNLWAYKAGYLGECIMVRGALTDDERQKFEGYLAHKWGFQASLPDTHPYKPAPPYVA